MRDEDEADFEEFVVERSAALLRTAVLLTHDRWEAEDLVQTALVRSYRHWRRVRAGGDPYAYVRRVLVTTYASWRRRRPAQQLVELPADDRPDPSPGPDVEGRDEMTRALAGLPPRMRAVLVLRYWEDLSEAATAAALGCSVNTVKTQTTRGLARLRAVLATDPASDSTADSTADTPGRA